jgi:hypothetical protein
MCKDFANRIKLRSASLHYVTISGAMNCSGVVVVILKSRAEISLEWCVKLL